jgi:small subunit ribosomal protein S21
MITIKVRRGDDPNRAMQKLKNLVIKEGLYKELKDRRYFAKPSLKKRLKREEAARTRVKDEKKAIRNAMRDEENWLS